ncbi:hypothetical protein BAE44_0003144 [Dichanthelium oligosanthes]|uniref:J domain-containing protein n=1 Tax=Dichanthelium oligosanthes TaxID=888268 RepID=A0A1E5WEM1_9POAL|nr:hypothetical protein BAE44_0003144 [Dichanthelium oligosanthes]
MMARYEREEAEKACQLAEELFLAGNVRGAHRQASRAKRLCPSLPGVANALAAYEVHAAAAPARRGRNWYAVLGLPTDAITHDDIKKQYRRLCLVLHPDKNRSAAADGAFKLLQQAWEALSDRHPPGSTSASKPSRTEPRPTHAPRPRAPPSSARTGRYGSRAPPPDWSSFGFTPPPEPDGSTFDFKAWRAAYARANGTIYCGHCDSESVAEGANNGKSGERCHSCGARFSPPQRSWEPPGTGAEPPPPPVAFTCPAACPRCGTRFSSAVSVGLCKLSCKACSYDATVHVRSRDSATAF